MKFIDFAGRIGWIFQTETMLQAHASSLKSPFILAIMDSTLYAASSEFEDKKLRRCMTLCCSRCTKTGGGFKRCARCKIPIYCSKECQKADWPQHKTRCAKVDTRASARVAQNLFKSEMLRSMLEAIFAIEMDIHNHPDMRRLLFGIQLDYIIEPINLEDLQTILNAKSLDDVPGPMMGMFQLTNCLRFGEVVPPPVAHSMWEQARNQLDDLGCYDKPVGILDLTNNAMSVETVLDINEKALDITQGSEHKLVPIPVSDDVNATPIVKPMSVVTFMEAINSIIRNDTDNHLRLRQEMRVSDKQTILDAAKDECKHFASVDFKKKMERELVYKRTQPM
ncbi:hypothetical protein BDN70DRAFT_335114 [Pholiota conissans]|uniref:MYND-type domain-containing protein n=1 Tax=Pholiota conissans TaxID=109636 RepID=A0A9P6CW42_9AGAR|nr:hypothetical protein BDN70DRAFT_335114 [Pholiota conissans]